MNEQNQFTILSVVCVNTTDAQLLFFLNHFKTILINLNSWCLNVDAKICVPTYTNN